MANIIQQIHPILRVVSGPVELGTLSPPISPSPIKPEENTQRTYGKLSWFLGGLIIGSMLQPFTVLVMIGIGLLIDNHPLPEMLGSFTPQDFTITILKTLIQSMISLVTKAARSDKS